MGMAASQARFLGLTSRKSNVEYEGQQINQQRTALGNQTANYYNQMLGMKIPVPPAIDEYTKTIYTFSDGALKNSVTSLIARNNGLYNVSYLREWTDDFAIVSAATSVITDNFDGKYRVGAQTLRPLGTVSNDPTIIDPYVTAAEGFKMSADSATDMASATSIANQAAQNAIDAANALPDGAYNKAGILAAAQAAQVKADDAAKTKAFAEASLDMIDLITDIDTDVKAAVNNAAGLTAPAYTGANIPIQDQAIQDVKDLADGLQLRQNELIQKMAQLQQELNNISPSNRAAAQNAFNATSMSASSAQEAIDKTQNFYEVAKNNYWRDTAATDDLIIKAGYGPGASYAGGKTPAMYAAESNGGAYKAADDAVNNLPNLQSSAAAAIAQALQMAKEAAADALNAVREAQMSMQLNDTDDEYLKTLSSDQRFKTLQQEQMYLAQLGGGNWTVRYIQNTTTGAWEPMFYNVDELEKAIYNENDISHSFINAYTVGSAKKNEEIKNVEARLEQDSTGRIINITLNPGTPEQVTYALTTNTIADQERYDDAINQYEYAKYQYDQAINEINAKIQIIQAQDKNLELRLKQLDTEQNAIQTEMDAVSKVIQKNVESTFKTFG